MGSWCVKLGVIALTLSYWSLEVQHGTSWQRTLWGSEKKEFEKKKIAMTLKLSCKTIRRLTWQVPFRTGLAMVNLRSWVHVLSIISRGCVWEIDIWVLPALLQRLKGWGGQPVSAQTILRTLHQIGLHGCRPRRKPLLKMIQKKAPKHWITGTMSCGLMRPR